MNSIKILLRAGVGLGLFATIFACSRAQQTKTTGAAHENVSSIASALYSNGNPCTADTQCTSAHCIDGVCCDTACGGGVRDNQACSNVYGTVAGLTVGTCKTLVAGDFCGELTTVNPCSWRGTTINVGGNCPNPPGTSTACFPCTTAADCTGAFRVCVASACVQCDGDDGSGTPAACPSSLPICTNGICSQCSAANGKACTGTTPACDAANQTCAACNGDNGSGATQACPTTARPACITTGSCEECSATNRTLCTTAAAPACNTTTNKCDTCNGDNGSAATKPCPTTDAPHCFTAGGTCGKCTGNADCTGNPAGGSCNTTTGACGSTCTLDTDCNDATKWCSSGVCIGKTANGEPLPAFAPINGVCTAASGTRVCASGVCDTTDNLCGLPNGATCGPPPTNAQCRSNLCSATDNKCGLGTGDPCDNQNDCRSGICAAGKCGTCQTDTTCGTTTSGQICNDTTKVCVAGCRGSGGNGCPAGQLCSSTDNTMGNCVQCLTDTDCGTPTSGKVCNPQKACQDGCRGAGGNGCPAGVSCSSLDGTIGTCGTGTDGGADAGDGGSGVDSGVVVADGGYGGADSGLGTSSSGSSGSPATNDGALEGGGCDCDSARTSRADAAASSGVVALAALGLLRRRRRGSRNNNNSNNKNA